MDTGALVTTTTAHVLPFVEALPPTIQGEGPAAGRHATFLRFGGCNLSCSWCDSQFTWNAAAYNLREQITMLGVPAILDRMVPAQIVVVTGGEPLLNQNNPAWPELLAALTERYSELHLETNGTLEPTLATRAAFSVINVSPKLPNAGEHRGNQDPALHPKWVSVGQAVLKFVVKDEADVAEAVRRATAGGWPLTRVWVMPEGITAAALDKRWPTIAAAAAAHGVNATHRLHVLAWGDERGH